MTMKLMNLTNLNLKFEYEVYLLNYTIKIKNLNWAFEVFRFLKN